MCTSVNDIPNRLYKYRSYDKRTEDILCNNRLYLPNAEQLNDKGEYKLRYIFEDNEKDEMLGKFEISECYDGEDMEYKPYEEENWYSIAKEYFDNEYRNDAQNSGILCLTKRWNNSVMWAMYANECTGICIEFSNNIIISQKAPIHGYVDYNPEQLNFVELFKCGNLNDLKNTQNIIARTYFTKNRDWSYEEEYRYVDLLANTHKDRFIYFESDDITGVYLGCKMDELSKALSIALTRYYHPKAKLYETYIDLYDLSIKRRELEV